MTNPLVEAYRTHLHDLTPYQPGAAPPGGTAGRLASNESSLGTAPAVRRAIRHVADQVHRYPSQHQARQELAEHLQVPVSCVMLTNGSDELCYLIAALAVGQDTTVVVPDPPYRIDEIASRLQRGSITRVPVRPDGSLDLPAMAAATTPGSVVWIPTPHNPTGVAACPHELEDLLDAVPEDALVVIDEAYRGFCDENLRPPTSRWVRQHGNLVVQRTFSKDYALAGLRAGYAVAAAETIQALDAIRPPFNLNIAACAAVVAALSEPGWRDHEALLIRRERAVLQRFLDGHDIGHYASQANFVTINLDHQRLAQPLASMGLTARAGDDLGLPGWTRVTIGTPQQMVLLRIAVNEAITTSTSPGAAT